MRAERCATFLDRVRYAVHLAKVVVPVSVVLRAMRVAAISLVAMVIALTSVTIAAHPRKSRIQATAAATQVSPTVSMQGAANLAKSKVTVTAVRPVTLRTLQVPARLTVLPAVHQDRSTMLHLARVAILLTSLRVVHVVLQMELVTVVYADPAVAP